MSYDEHVNSITLCANEVANYLDADVLLYNGHIDWSLEPGRNLIDLCESIDRRRDAMLVLVTGGGDPDAAYRMARCLQQKYTAYKVLVPGYCMSAGSLIALGAEEIVMSDHGQIGPLDMQIAKTDELWESGSALDTIQALKFLKNDTFSMFGDNLVDLKRGSRNQVTLKTATEIATALTTGLYKSVYEQLDPTKLGEVSRAISIAEEYGDRLVDKFKNAQDGALAKLVAGYPTHSFVIDREEASQLFYRVREPEAAEINLIRALNDYVSGLAQVPNVHTDPSDPRPEPLMAFLSNSSSPPQDRLEEQHYASEHLRAANNDRAGDEDEPKETEPAVKNEGSPASEPSQEDELEASRPPRGVAREEVNYAVTREEVSYEEEVNYESTSTNTDSESQ